MTFAIIGIGQIISGYLNPNSGKELTNAVDKYEKNKLEKELQEPSTNFTLKISKTLHCKVEELFKLPE